MLYAFIAIIALLLIFVFVSFFLTYKKYSFNVEGSTVLVENKGAHLKLYINGSLCEDNYMPQLIKGEEYKLLINGKDVFVKCKSSALGFRMRVEIVIDGKVVADNGVNIKEKTRKKDFAKEDENQQKTDI